MVGKPGGYTLCASGEPLGAGVNKCENASSGFLPLMV